MSKAFHTVDHEILYEKLPHMGFRGKYSCLFKNCFTGRYQPVRTGNAMSGELTITNKAPQLTLYFLIFIWTILTIYLFPACWGHSVGFWTFVVQTSLKLFKRIWASATLDAWELRTRQQKQNKLICIRSPYKQIQLNRKIFPHLWICNGCSCSTLEYSPSVKCLGFCIDKFFNWDEHINQVCKKTEDNICLHV